MLLPLRPPDPGLVLNPVGSQRSGLAAHRHAVSKRSQHMLPEVTTTPHQKKLKGTHGPSFQLSFSMPPHITKTGPPPSPPQRQLEARVVLMAVGRDDHMDEKPGFRVEGFGFRGLGI